MADLAVSLGLAPGLVMLEDRSANTLDNARYTLALVRDMAKAGRIVVVTDQPHVGRALMCFRAVARAWSLPVSIEGAGVEIASRRAARLATIREAFARGLYHLRLRKRGALAEPDVGHHDGMPTQGNHRPGGL